jgi:hypothetical protein
LSKSRDSFSYEGFFKEDKIHGYGKLVYANGDTFVGNFEDNKKNGAGLYYNKAKEETYEGNWVMDVKSGKFVETKRNKNERIVGQYVNG